MQNIHFGTSAATLNVGTYRYPLPCLLATLSSNSSNLPRSRQSLLLCKTVTLAPALTPSPKAKIQNPPPIQAPIPLRRLCQRNPSTCSKALPNTWQHTKVKFVKAYCYEEAFCLGVFHGNIRIDSSQIKPADAI